MSQGKVLGAACGIKINGIIEEYTVASGGNVSAGDFVKFVNEYGTDTQLDTGKIKSAVLLNENKVFIAYGKGNNILLYGIVCTISGTTITIGTETQLSTDSYSGSTVSAVVLNENKVFIAHRANNYLNAIICEINETIITTGTDTQISTDNYSGYIISAVKLNESKVFIAHSRTSNYNLNAIICTLSGTTITVGTDTQLSTNNYTGYTISVVALNESKVFIAHSNSSYYNLYGTVCTIEETTITAGTLTQLSTGNYTGKTISAITLNENKVFIAHSSLASGSGTYYDLYAIICTINNTTITAGTDTQLSNNKYSGDFISTIKLTENRIFIAHSYNSNKLLYGIVCRLSGAIISTEIDDTLISNILGSDANATVVRLNNDKAFIAHSGTDAESSTTYRMYGIILKTKIMKSAIDIGGIAKTSATMGNNAKIYEPNY